MKRGSRSSQTRAVISVGWATSVPALLLSVVSACATVGPAPAALSAKLGDRMGEMRGLHQFALERVFDSERRRVEDFIDNEWTPLFLKNFLAKSQLLAEIGRLGTVGEHQRALLRTAIAQFLADTSEAEAAANRIADAVTGSRTAGRTAARAVLADFVDDSRLDAVTLEVIGLLGSDDPGLLILEWAGDAQAQINAQRREMLEPLDDAHRHATAELSEAYAEMLKANGVITARLTAASKGRAQQDAALQALGVGDAATKLQQRLASISGRVGAAIESASALLERGSEGEVARKLRDALGGGR